MNFAWQKLRHLVAVSLTQSIILSQTCAVTIAAQPAGDESTHLNDSAVKNAVRNSNKNASAQKVIASASPVSTARPPDTATEPGTTSNTNTADNNQTEGLRFIISPGKQTQDSEEMPPVAHTTPLSNDETNKLLKLLPPLVEEKGKEFVLPGKSLPPPNDQNRLNVPFPPHEQKSANAPQRPASSPLTITNKRPSSNVDHASSISVSFSQPMVPVSTQSSLETKTPPLSFTPAIDGQWKWFGTQTLTFEPTTKRLPMSTHFDLKIPSGTTSVTGGKLEKNESWNFSTSTVHLTSSYPNTDISVRSHTLIMARFNQKIDREAILAMTQLSAGKKSFPIVPATKSEIDGDPILKERLIGVTQSTYVVFKSASPLPLATRFAVKIGPNIKSAEGPLLSKNPANFQFQTYGPFKLLSQSAGDRILKPDWPLTARFSNKVDPASVNKSTVVISPPIPDAQMQANEWDSTITITGHAKPRSSYQVLVKSGLKDIYGQSLVGNQQPLKFVVSSVDKQLHASEQMTVLSGEHKPKITVSTVNLNTVEMQVYSVTPKEYTSFALDRNTFLKRKPFHAETIKVKNIAEQAVVTTVDLSPWLKNNRGSLVVGFKSREIPRDYQALAWVQVTNIGLNALSDLRSVKAWVTDLSNGRPVKGASVFLAAGGPAYQTDEHGLVTIPLKNAGQLLIAKSGNDTAFVFDSYWLAQSGDYSDYLWYVVTDRSPYRPGEKINVKGTLRRRLPEPRATPTIPAGIKNLDYRFVDSRNNEIGNGKTKINKFGGFDLSFTLPEKVNLGELTLILTAVEKAQNEEIYPTHDVRIKVSEFRRPEFELKVANDGSSVHVVKGSTTISATTNYFAGGNLAHADINWTASAAGTTYSPPGWSEFLFGKSRFSYFGFSFDGPPGFASTPSQNLKGTTDGGGKNYLHVDYLDVHPSEPSNLTISATVQDVNRQTWTDSTTLLVHPSELYIGTKLDTIYVKKNASIPLSCITTNIDGKAVENTPVKIEFYRPTEQMVDGRLVKKKDDLQTLNITSGVKPVEVKLQPRLGGSYEVVASVLDSSGRRNETISTFYSDGGAARAESSSEAKFDLQKLILLPEKTEYTPGDTAKFLIQSPFYPAEGLATIWHNGRLTSIPFHMDGSSYNLEVPIAESDVPEIGLQVDVLGIDNQNAQAKDAPAEATGAVTIDVSLKHKKLTVAAKPDVASAVPGQEVSIDVDVTDYKGSAVADAEVTLAVVDDALLSLLNYNFSDPMKTFYPQPKTDGMTLRERENLDMTTFLKKPNIMQSKSESNTPHGAFVPPAALPPPSALPPPPLPGGAGAPQAAPASYAASRGSAEEDFSLQWGGADKKKSTVMRHRSATTPALCEPGDASMSVQLRSNFDALAKWAPAIVTDQNGHAVVKLKLPDNLTRYRIMAVASHGETDFGSGDSSLTARLPLMVKPSAPRFLNYGDKFDLPVVLRNQTDAPVEVDVAARASNAQFTQGQGRHTTIAANDRVEVRIPASTIKSGTAKFQVVALSGTNSDAAEFSLPVYTPATGEAFATYGQIENGAIVQSVETPQDVIPEYGSLELTTSTTVLETLTDAFIYLQQYPFECSEQISSRLISISLMKDVLKQFHAAGVPKDAEIARTISSDLQKLKSRQRDDGGFALWSTEDRETYPYVTLNVAQALILANQAGYKVDAGMLEKTMGYLKNIDKHLTDYTGSAHTDLKAMAIYLRDRNGDSDISAAHALFTAQPIDKLSLEALGYLLQVFAHKNQSSKDAIALYTYLNNCIVETASTAEVVRGGNEGIACKDYRLFDSPSKVKAILLDSLLAEGKSPETVTKLMRSLLGGQVKGRWRNTQENANVLLAMRHYFDKYEKTVPDLLADAWFGRTFIGEATFKGRSNDFKTISLPMGYLCDTDSRTRDLILKKSGSGRLYYRLGLNYAPKSLHLSSLDRGFSVTRRYEGVKNKDDAKKNSEGVWQFKAGSLIKVNLTVKASAERFFVAVVDPIPAGAESLNQDLSGTESVSDKDSASSSYDASGSELWGWRWWNTWWNHENKRDNETEVFADQLWGGTHEYSYLIRATTPGQYVVPPTKAEEMYAPETFGRTATETVVIE